MEDELLFTVKETAEILKTSTDYVYKATEAGLLDCMLLGRKKIKKTTLEKFLEKWEGWDVTDPFNPKQLTQQ